MFKFGRAGGDTPYSFMQGTTLPTTASKRKLTCCNESEMMLGPTASVDKCSPAWVFQ